MMEDKFFMESKELAQQLGEAFNESNPLNKATKQQAKPKDKADRIKYLEAMRDNYQFFAKKYQELIDYETKNI